MNKGMYTSTTDLWSTPQKTFDELNEEFNFDVDVCADDSNAKCKKYYTKEIDGLNQEWIGNCYMNPPYGREIGNWIKKAYESSLQGATVVCLLPSRTDTRWFHDYCVKGEIRFIKGRLQFGTDEYWNYVWNQEYIENKKNPLYLKFGRKNSAPFPSMVVIFKYEE